MNLLCSVTGSNPSSFTLFYNTSSFYNASSLLPNVAVTETDVSINVSFTDPSSENSGFYNCTASTDVAKTTLSYLVFFGGKYIRNRLSDCKYWLCELLCFNSRQSVDYKRKLCVVLCTFKSCTRFQKQPRMFFSTTLDVSLQNFCGTQPPEPFGFVPFCSREREREREREGG